MMIMPPTDNRTPVVAQAFADITITLKDGGPDQWASGDLGTNFSDPDGDELSYSAGSSDESVVDAVISESGPIVIAQAQGGGTATITITARDPGGLTATQSFRVTVNDKPDHSNTPAGATAIELSESFQGRIDSPNDVDYFRLRVDSPGTLTIRTTGNAGPDIAVFDGAGNEVPGVSGSWIGSITQDILDRGRDLLVRFSGGNAGAEYTGSATLDQTLQTSPDLSVGSPTVSDSSPAPGASFTLSATVNNAGDGESAATTLRYYRSTDATITTSDTEVGTDAVGALAASGTSAQSISLAAPATAGAYYYGACVDAVTDESDTTNNCSPSVTIAVEEESSGQPDLRIVGIITLTPLDGVGPGSPIHVSASVRNYGDANSDATTLRYYRSTNATISVSDTEVGTDEVSALVPSGQVSEGIDLTAPSPAGTYYYGACVDAVTNESDTTNNCSGSLAITVPEPEPDLVVGSPTVSDSSPTSGASFTLSATVRNAGGAASSSTTLRYYRSTDATITTSDTSVGTDAVGTLAAAGTSSELISLTAPSSAGTYYYGACVDAVTGESDTTNNCSSSVTVTVPEPEPDLVVGSPTVSDSSPETGGAFTLSATVSNDGDGAAAATTLRYYRSTDATITTSDTSVGTDTVGALAAAGTTTESVDLTAPSRPGTYYYGACVDAVAGEADTTDNCSGSMRVTVRSSGTQVQVTSDLEAYAIVAYTGVGLTPGVSFTLSVSVRNNGSGSSPSTTLRYYQSTDATVTTSDTEVGTDDVPALAPSGTSTQSESLNAPSTPGTYYYGACVDTVTDESDTTNNCASAVQVTVWGPQETDGLPLVRIGSTSRTVTEGMSARYRVTATPPPTADLEVNIGFAELVITEHEVIVYNYAPEGTTVTVNAGSSSTTLMVETIDDSDADGNSWIHAWVKIGSGYTTDFHNNASIVAVVDDD